jgi:hypothetical protein
MVKQLLEINRMQKVKKNLLVSFSGGETSAYMAQWLWKNKQEEYHMIFVFANTGEENEATLLFVEQCSNYFGFPVVWLEAVPRVKLFGKILEMCSEIFNLPWTGSRIGTTYKKVNFETAARTGIGNSFEAVIQKYGIPNPATPHCSRELKQHPIEAYARAKGWKDYYTAIGIRGDEIDRINEDWKELKLLYPLIVSDMRPMTKPKINFWWSQQPFRLELKGYQGNCKWCWKKYINKHYKIAQENPEHFYFPELMERKYGEYIPETRLAKILKRGELPSIPVRFFRGHKSVAEIKEGAKTFIGDVGDDSQEFESCEVFAKCV